MSVRAYRVNAVQIVHTPSFNCWHDKRLMDFLDKEEMYDARNMDGSGAIELSVQVMQKALDKAKELKLEEYAREAIEADIAWAKKKGWDFIRYECF